MDETSTVYSAEGPEAAQSLRSGPPSAVRQALLEARACTLALADAYEAALGPALEVPYAPGLNPPRWEWGHVAWFQEWWIGRNAQRDRGVACDPDHERPPSDSGLRDDWYDSSRVAHADRWRLPLPDAAATRDALARSLAQTLALLDALPPSAPDDALYFFRLAALHECMHIEAARYMALALGLRVPQPVAPKAGTARELLLPAQRWRQGDAPQGFAFDNELGPHAVDVGALAIDDRPVSVARFRAFVEDGGYRRRELWSPAGWDWLQSLSGAPPLPPGPGDAPAVFVNAHEADAWCRWAGRRLPTEAEWECAALTLPGFTWGAVWEWTASDFVPFPGFVPHPYRDYSQPWFGTRRALRGASAATPPALAHVRYRNFFEPHRRDIVAGFRSCRTVSAADAV